ncbi:hypothetical protein [Bernardetia sp.]|uniref:hypothetical protein n=1 Tax=Bernardetia sp. TaxID=1937974 RepID=UPI0025C19FE8|nr:hypothetical protein [Bernardetia sp.]
MSKSSSKQEIIGSAKRAFSINFPFYVFALGILLAFSAFQCEDEEDWCATPTCEVEECEIINVANVTVENIVCGVGVWDNLWLNDGSNVYLQPYSLDEYNKSKLEKLEIEDKMQLKIQYVTAKKDDRYKDVAVCMAYVGESRPITIIDIEIIEN